jgi:hypothetical protein
MEKLDLHTIGHISQQIQPAPGAIETTLAELHIEPVLILNGLQYFSVDAETQVDGRIRDLEIKRLESQRRK